MLHNDAIIAFLLSLVGVGQPVVFDTHSLLTFLKVFRHDCAGSAPIALNINISCLVSMRFVFVLLRHRFETGRRSQRLMRKYMEQVRYT